jgi:hypothetical protein
LLLWAWSGDPWEGPLSFRKPVLFGISAGVSVWSLHWVLAQLPRQQCDRLLDRLVSWGLLLEVSLITLQTWRGVPSHFNQSTLLDASIETAMLLLITAVSGVIFWLTRRTHQLSDRPLADRWAMQGGMWLLSISCLLGFVITAVGMANLAAGRPVELWGPGGVLKYPHGAAMHAIQLLPLVNGFLAWRGVDSCRRATPIKCLFWSQALFLGQALWQTFRGRPRFETDLLALSLLVLSGILLLPAVSALLQCRTDARNGRLW